MTPLPEAPLVTVLVPARNEEADIAGCIRAVAAQDHPIERIELVVADGCSTDGTTEVAIGAMSGRPFHRAMVVDNPSGGIAAGLNAGLAAARGDYVVRVDARSRIPSEYIGSCVRRLAARPEVGVVGGAQVAVARSRSLVERGIARSLRNRWTTGLARYRRRFGSGPTDTVWMGAFRTSELREVHGWPSELAVNEDYELNQRYRARGALVWYEAGLASRYLPRTSLRRLFRQYFAFGHAKGRRWRSGDRPAGRHVALCLAPPVAALVALVAGRRWGAGRTMVAALGLGLAVDACGHGRDSTSLVERHVSVAATATFTIGWWSGVVMALARRPARPARAAGGSR